MKRAFTLIEVLISISILSIILLSGSIVFSSFYRSYKIIQKKINPYEARQYVLHSITRDCMASHKIEVQGNKAKFYTKDGIIAYELINNKVKRQKDKSTSYLTDQNEIKSLKFSQLKPDLLLISIDSKETEAAKRNEE